MFLVTVYKCNLRKIVYNLETLSLWKKLDFYSRYFAEKLRVYYFYSEMCLATFSLCSQYQCLQCTTSLLFCLASAINFNKKTARMQKKIKVSHRSMWAPRVWWSRGQTNWNHFMTCGWNALQAVYWGLNLTVRRWLKIFNLEKKIPINDTTLFFPRTYLYN